MVFFVMVLFFLFLFFISIIDLCVMIDLPKGFSLSQVAHCLTQIVLSTMVLVVLTLSKLVSIYPGIIFMLVVSGNKRKYKAP